MPTAVAASIAITTAAAAAKITTIFTATKQNHKK